MFEEACALAGRNGTTDVSPENAAEFITHADLIDDSRPSGAVLAEELSVGDVPHVYNPQTISSNHTAAPELAHPGESQTNGEAERSVGIFEDQFRTLKYALEQHLKRRLPISHPVTSWMIEHTAWVLNKFHLEADGRTGYGRLHGREGQ